MSARLKAKISTKDLKKFGLSLNKLNPAQRQQWSESAVRELATRLFSEVMKRTPVGEYPEESSKHGGTLKENWRIGLVQKMGSLYSLTIDNPIYYAEYVEFGHRTANHKGWVNGKFMLTISEAELEADATGILKNKLNRFLKEVFK